MRGPLRRIPWRAPIWDSGENGSLFVPGLLRKQTTIWDEVGLLGHHRREELLSYVRYGVSVHGFLVESHRGASVDSPYKVPGRRVRQRYPTSPCGVR